MRGSHEVGVPAAQPALGEIRLNVTRLRILAITVPLLFLLGLETVSLMVLVPLLGTYSISRLLIIFIVLTVAVVGFSYWMFGLIERQQRSVLQNAAMLESVQDYAIFMVDPHGVVQTWNLAAERINGYHAQDIMGRHISHFYIPEDVVDDLPDKNLAHAAELGHWEDEGWRIRGDGSCFWASVSTTAVRDSRGRLIGFTHVIRDLTERKREEEALRQSEARFREWNEELERKVSERTAEIQSYSRELTTRVLQAQEDERRRIARELHDENAQSLSTLMITLDLAEGQLGPEDIAAKNLLDRSRSLAHHVLDETRALSHDLRPTILDDVGLIAALNWYASEFTNTFGVPVEVRTAPEPGEALTADFQLAFFRIAQEALMNAGKYAHASQTRITLTFEDGTACLVIEDNGKGFEVEAIHAPSRQGGLGLYGMYERAELLGGTLTIESTLGQGTRVVARVPLTVTGLLAPAPV